MRSDNPQVTTLGPESQRIFRTGGTLRSARIRSPHAFWEPDFPLPLMESQVEFGRPEPEGMG